MTVSSSSTLWDEVFRLVFFFGFQLVLPCVCVRAGGVVRHVFVFSMIDSDLLHSTKLKGFGWYCTVCECHTSFPPTVTPQTRFLHCTIVYTHIQNSMVTVCTVVRNKKATKASPNTSLLSSSGELASRERFNHTVHTVHLSKSLVVVVCFILLGFL